MVRQIPTLGRQVLPRRCYGCSVWWATPHPYPQTDKNKTHGMRTMVLSVNKTGHSKCVNKCAHVMPNFIVYSYRSSCGYDIKDAFIMLRPSCLHNEISYTGKMTSLYWIRAQGPGWVSAVLKARQMMMLVIILVSDSYFDFDALQKVAVCSTGVHFTNMD